MIFFDRGHYLYAHIASFIRGTPILLALTEDEQLFRDSVRQFAEEAVRPLVKEMDEKGVFEHSLIEQFFQLGLMGIEIPEQYGGGGASFFEAILAVEELSRVDPSAAVVVDVQNTLVNNAIIRWANEQQKKKYLPKMASEWVGAYALSEAGSGPMLSHCSAAPRTKATTGCSTGRRCGSPMARKQACLSC